MSSAPSGQQPKQQAKGAQAGPPPEKKQAKGPVVTPQALGILFGIILIVGIAVYYFMVIKENTEKQDQLRGQITQTESQIQTYKKKGARLQDAISLNTALREKLNMLDYLFLQDQGSILPFYENTLLPLIESSTLEMGTIEPLEVYNFRINMAMSPFNTIPAVGGIEEPQNQFTISYEPEQGGTPTETPVTTSPSSFLTPYSLRLTEFSGTYEDVIKFVRKLQTDRNARLITVHCIRNDEGNNSTFYRTSTTWDMVITVYFMNPEQNASGDMPPSPPGSQTC